MYRKGYHRWTHWAKFCLRCFKAVLWVIFDIRQIYASVKGQTCVLNKLNHLARICVSSGEFMVFLTHAPAWTHSRGERLHEPHELFLLELLGSAVIWGTWMTSLSASSKLFISSMLKDEVQSLSNFATSTKYMNHFLTLVYGTEEQDISWLLHALNMPLTCLSYDIPLLSVFIYTTAARKFMLLLKMNKKIMRLPASAQTEKYILL